MRYSANNQVSIPKTLEQTDGATHDPNENKQDLDDGSQGVSGTDNSSDDRRGAIDELVDLEQDYQKRLALETEPSPSADGKNRDGVDKGVEPERCFVLMEAKRGGQTGGEKGREGGC